MRVWNSMMRCVGVWMCVCVCVCVCVCLKTIDFRDEPGVCARAEARVWV